MGVGPPLSRPAAGAAHAAVILASPPVRAGAGGAVQVRLRQRGRAVVADVEARQRGQAAHVGRRLEPVAAHVEAGEVVEAGELRETGEVQSNFGQLRRNNDRRPRHRLAQLALAIALLLTAKLIDWRNRWSPT